MQTTDKLDEILRLFTLENVKEADDQTAANAMKSILQQRSTIEMGADKRMSMISALSKVVNGVSFGALLKQQMMITNDTAQTLAAKTRLPEPVIGQLVSDSMFTNNVPVMMMKQLLNELQISFDAAQSAIRFTFNRLKVNADELLSTGSTYAAVPAYRKGGFLSKESVAGNAGGNGKDLFENEQVMEKYLKRLKELSEQ